jgi:hypothetical protein
MSCLEQTESVISEKQETIGGRQTWASGKETEELWGWELRQQHSYARGTIDPQREAMLAELGYWEPLGLTRSS